VQGLGVYSFSQSTRLGFDVGLINERVMAFVENNARKLNDAIDTRRTQEFEYFGLKTLHDRYLLKHPTRRVALESPQQFWMRIACSLSTQVHEAIASIAGCYECIEPQVSNLFKRETLSGDFLQVNCYLVEELKQLGLWTDEIRDAIKLADGSVQSIGAVPEALRAIYRTAWELPMRSLIDLAAARGAYIDQSQSLNLFIANPTIGQLSSMYMYAWKSGVKTTYYLRSRPATQIAKTTVAASAVKASDTEAVVCSLENPEMCEACQ
jgi:ribonucleoside-diphosphate reductase alpha chain